MRSIKKRTYSFCQAVHSSNIAAAKSYSGKCAAQHYFLPGLFIAFYISIGFFKGLKNELKGLTSKNIRVGETILCMLERLNLTAGGC